MEEMKKALIAAWQIVRKYEGLENKPGSDPAWSEFCNDLVKLAEIAPFAEDIAKAVWKYYKILEDKKHEV